MFVLIFLFVNANASDFGVYEKVVEKAKANPDELAGAIASGIESSEFTFLNKIELHTPNLIR